MDVIFFKYQREPRDLEQGAEADGAVGEADVGGVHGDHGHTRQPRHLRKPRPGQQSSLYECQCVELPPVVPEDGALGVEETLPPAARRHAHQLALVQQRREVHLAVAAHPAVTHAGGVFEGVTPPHVFPDHVQAGQEVEAPVHHAHHAPARVPQQPGHQPHVVHRHRAVVPHQQTFIVILHYLTLRYILDTWPFQGNVLETNDFVVVPELEIFNPHICNQPSQNKICTFWTKKDIKKISLLCT